MLELKLLNYDSSACVHVDVGTCPHQIQNSISFLYLDSLEPTYLTMLIVMSKKKSLLKMYSLIFNRLVNLLIRSLYV